MSLPLPLRLTLFYALLLGLALWGFGSLVYHQAEQRGYADLDKLLSNRAASVQFGKDIFAANDPANPHPIHQLPGVNAIGGEGVAIKVFDPNLLLLASTDTDAIPVLNTTIAGFRADKQPWDMRQAKWILAHPYTDASEHTLNYTYSTIFYQGEPVRVYTTANNAFGAINVIQTAKSEQLLQQSLADLRSTLLTGGLLVMLLGLAGGLGLTWGSLAAVRRVTSTAQAISEARDFRQRVPLKSSLGSDEIVTLAATFNAMLANLEQAYQQQKRFIADASHELRAPITSISCNLDLLVRAPDLPCDERNATLLDARSEAERMGRLVGDLLTLARADEIASTRERPGQNGQIAEEKGRVDLDSLMLEVFRQYRGTQAEEQEKTVPRLTLQHIMPAQVYGQADQLKQALVALLDNALKYTPAAGSVTLSLSVEGQQATLSVSDTGIGIAPEDLPHIFERFYRADRARSREEGGSGLGLAIVQSIAQEHHGHVTVESTPGKGSTFALSLPCVEK